jgi:branched-chain amino acid transport system substrate-binding protein
MTRTFRGYGRPAVRRPASTVLAVVALAALAAAGCSSSSSSSSPASSAPGTSGASPGAATGAATGTSASGTQFVVGALGTFTGAASGSTADAKVVFQDWVDATNAAGGINGHPVRAIILDDQNTPSVAVSNAEQLVQQDHVKVIFDLSDNLESTWAKVVDTAHVPVIGQSEAPIFGTDANFYPTGTTVGPLVWGELKAASLAKVSKAGALYCAEIASCSQTVPLFTSLGKPLGVNLVYSAQISSSAVSYTAQCVGAKNAGVTGATVVAASDVYLRVAESCAAQGYKPVWVTVGEATTPWLAQPAVNGEIGVIPDAPWYDTSVPAIATMQAAIQKYSPGVESSASFGGTAVIGYPMGVVFATVAKTAGLTPNSSQTAIIAALDSVKNDTFGGLTPPLTYTAGKPTQVPCSFVSGISGGKWTMPAGPKPVCQPAA